jgi:hypothetical protein
MITIRIEHEPHGAYKVLTDGWGTGVDFATYTGALGVAEAIADAYAGRARINDTVTGESYEWKPPPRVFQVRHSDSGEPVLVDGQIDLGLGAVTNFVAKERDKFDPANSPEPYAPWGLHVVEILYDDAEHEVIQKPVDWRELLPDEDPRLEHDDPEEHRSREET